MINQSLAVPFVALLIGFSMLATGILLAIVTGGDLAAGRISPAMAERESRLSRHLTLGGLAIIAFVTAWRLARP